MHIAPRAETRGSLPSAVHVLRHKHRPLVAGPEIAAGAFRLEAAARKQASISLVQLWSAGQYIVLPACGVLATDAVCNPCSAGALKARASSQTVSSVSAEGPLPVLLQQNLARVLVRAGRLQEAVGLYERLQAEGEQPHRALHSALH